MNLLSVAATLSECPLFSGLPDTAIDALVKAAALQHFQAEQVIFRKGDLGDALYVVITGQVAVMAVVNRRVLRLNNLGRPAVNRLRTQTPDRRATLTP